MHLTVHFRYFIGIITTTPFFYELPFAALYLTSEVLISAPYTDPFFSQRSFSPDVVKEDSEKWVCQRRYRVFLLDSHLVPKVYILFVTFWNCR